MGAGAWRQKGGRGMIEEATLAPLRALAGRTLELCDMDAACVLLIAQGKTPTETAAELSRLCAPGGEADRLADALENPQAARDYARSMAATFAPFAEIVRGITPGGDVRYIRYGYGYRKTTVAGLKEAEAKQKRREARAIATPEEAAERLNVKRMVVFEYIREGKLVGVYRDGKRNPYGVTRQSLEAYAEKQEMRKAATLAKAQAKADRRAEKKEHGGIYYTEDGRKVHGAERVSAVEACATFGRGRSQIAAWANAGKIERVYIDPNRRHPVGYLREAVERYAAEREIAAAAGGTYYTAAGKIVGAERISRSEAAQLLDFKELTVTAICRRGEIAHVYADPACTIPCGYTRASVEAWAQAHPRHIPARKAQAIPDFMIAPLPPPPRNHGLRAARLDPDATGEAAGEKPAAVIEGDAPPEAQKADRRFYACGMERRDHIRREGAQHGERDEREARRGGDADRAGQTGDRQGVHRPRSRGHSRNMRERGRPRRDRRGVAAIPQGESEARRGGIRPAAATRRPRDRRHVRDRRAGSPGRDARRRRDELTDALMVDAGQSCAQIAGHSGQTTGASPRTNWRRRRGATTGDAPYLSPRPSRSIKARKEQTT